MCCMAAVIRSDALMAGRRNAIRELVINRVVDRSTIATLNTQIDME